MSKAIAALTALRESGADRVDPVRFHFMETLAQRAQTQQANVAQLLDEKLAQAVAAYQGLVEQSGKDAKKAMTRAAKQFPDAADALKQHFDAGDFAALRRMIAGLAGKAQGRPLAELLAYMEQQTPEAPEHEASEPVVSIGDRAELKSVRYFRDAWSRLSVEQQVSHSFSSAPENAGPLNSHLLVLKAMELMRDTAPEYLSHFITYADSLLWLEQAMTTLPAKKSTIPSDGEKKRKAARARAR